MAAHTIASIDALARRQLAAYDGRLSIAPPGTSDPSFDNERGYEVLARILELRRARGERMVGRKLGFTNRNIWLEYGVDSPNWAPVYDTTLVRHDGDSLAFSLQRMMAPRIEPEIAFGLGGAVTPAMRSPQAVLPAIAWVAPAFEIVDCHYPDWKFRGADTIAQQALHGALILGRQRTLDPKWAERLVDELRDCRATLYRDGEVADRGVGANALGHPLLALAFLAEMLAGQPQFPPLAAGEVITTGTLTAALPIAPGETWRYTLDGIELPELSARFG